MLSFFPDMQRFATRTLGPQKQKEPRPTNLSDGASPRSISMLSFFPGMHIFTTRSLAPQKPKKSLAPKITRMEPHPAAQVCSLSFLTCTDKQHGVSPRANKKKGASPHGLLKWSLAPQQKSAFVVSLSWRARIHTKEPRTAKTKMGASPR